MPLNLHRKISENNCCFVIQKSQDANMNTKQNEASAAKALEKYVADSDAEGQSQFRIATELNRSEASIDRVLKSAHKKLQALNSFNPEQGGAK